MAKQGESANDDCDYCYGQMGICPVCGPFEYASSFSVGYDHAKGLNAEHFDGFELYGAGLDWSESANKRGWCQRDTQTLFKVMYEGADCLRNLSVRALAWKGNISGKAE